MIHYVLSCYFFKFRLKTIHKIRKTQLLNTLFNLTCLSLFEFEIHEIRLLLERYCAFKNPFRSVASVTRKPHALHTAVRRVLPVLDISRKQEQQDSRKI